ncbi:MAG: hypothetical protein JXN65_08850 [Clostridia bacterium]|nr:hypothetical protein [Clostridia bacterium]
MENNFKKIYGVMGIIGEAIGIGAFILAISKNVFANTSYVVLISALFVLLIIARVISLFKNSKIFSGIGEFYMSIVKGHISLMLGACIMISVLMFINGKAFSDTIVILVITAVFMSTMLMFMIGTFEKIRKLSEESEKEE